MIRPILNRFGTKTSMVDKILKIMPTHRVYVEPFGGVALVLLNKPQSKREIYNDIDGHLVNFFRVLREKEKRERLKDMLNYTPYSREIYYEAMNALEDGEYEDDVWRAYYYFVLCNQSYRGKLFGGWGISKTTTNRYEEKVFRNKIQLIDVVAKRLKDVVIENKDFKEILEIYDGDDVLFYFDPPYYLDSEFYTGETEYYNSDFGAKEHKIMLDAILELHGFVILSGYRNKLYEKLEEDGWLRLDFPIKKNSSQEKEKPIIYESLWINFDLEKTERFVDEFKNHRWW